MLPAGRTFWRISTKAAPQRELGTPRTVAAAPAALADWSGPVMIKPANHAASRFAPRRFDAASDAMALVREFYAAGGRPLAQDLVDGRLVAFAAVADREGRLVTQPTNRRADMANRRRRHGARRDDGN